MDIWSILTIREGIIQNLGRSWVFIANAAKQRKEAQKLKHAKPAPKGVSVPEHPIPKTNEEREIYFMQNLQLGEQLMQQGLLNL